MEKSRQIKVMFVMALVLSVTAMTLGFAAFSTTLNISSSASVTPSSSDFKITMYGFNDATSYEAFRAGGKVFNLNYVNTTSAYGICSNDNIEYDNLIINNSTYSIQTSDIKIKDNSVSVTYHILLLNEGEYDAYVDIDNYPYSPTYSAYWNYKTGNCSPDVGTSSELTAAACSDLQLLILFTPTEKCIVDETSGTYLIPKGEYGVVSVVIGATSDMTLTDGPFTVNFPEYKLNISTAK